MKALTIEEIETIEAGLHLQEGFPCSQADFIKLLEMAKYLYKLQNMEYWHNCERCGQPNEIDL